MNEELSRLIKKILKFFENRNTSLLDIFVQKKLQDPSLAEVWNKEIQLIFYLKEELSKAHTRDRMIKALSKIDNFLPGWDFTMQDCDGTPLEIGDNVEVIKDLPIGNNGEIISKGTIIKNIRPYKKDRIKTELEGFTDQLFNEIHRVVIETRLTKKK